jgi:chemotaxis protein MotD
LQINIRKSGGPPVPQVASESSAYALNRALTATARPSYAADRTAATPFESLIDDAPARPAAPEPRAQRAADDTVPPADRPQSRADGSKAAKSDDKSRPDRPDTLAKDNSAADSASKDAANGPTPADAKASDTASGKANGKTGEKSDDKTATDGDLKAADDATALSGDPAAGQTPAAPDAAAIPAAPNGAAVANDAPPADGSAADDAIAAAKAGQPQIPAALPEKPGKAGKSAEADDGKIADSADVTANAKGDGKTGAPTDAKANADTEATVSAATDLKTDAKADAAPDAKTNVKAEVQTAAVTGADTAAAPDAEAAATTDAQAATAAGVKAEAKTDTKAGAKTDAGATAAKTTAMTGPNAATPADANAQAGSGEPQHDATAHANAQTAANDHRGVAADGDAKSSVKPSADNNAAVTKPSADFTQPQTLTEPAPAATPAATAATQAAAAAPTAATVTQDSKPVPFSGVAIEITSKALAGKNHFDIRLDPPDLGRIHVRLDVDKDGNVISHMVADRTDTLDMLRRDSSGLERALQDAGLKTSNNSLQFSLNDQSANRQQNDNDGGADRARLVVEDEQLKQATPIQNNYIRNAGQAGGLDIRV